MPATALRVWWRVIAVMTAAALLGCDKVQLPQLVHGPPDLPRLPISATLTFDDTIRDARLEAEACGDFWEGDFGHALASAFLRTSRESFARVQTGEAREDDPQSGGASSDLLIEVKLQRNSFERSTVFGAEDTYTARHQVELLAILLTPQGVPIGKTPLRYDERLNIWTPSLGGGAGSCSTGQLDGAMTAAADDLARQMVSAVATWAARAQPGAGRQPVAPPLAGMPVQPQPLGSAPLLVKATLLDENDNLILEGGEKIGVRIDATNAGQNPLTTAAISLSGTKTLIDAFTAVAAAPLEIGPLQPGETKSTMFWGRLPQRVEGQRGELIVAVATPGGTTSQTLVAGLRPASGAARAFSDQQQNQLASPRGAATPRPAGARHAVVVGVAQYASPWPQAMGDRALGADRVALGLKDATQLDTEQLLLLRNRLATKGNLEQAVLKWLPERVNGESIILFYLSGHALTDGTSGEVFFVPYEGKPTSQSEQLISLHALQGTLKRIGARLCLLVVDAPILYREAPDGRTRRPPSPDWRGVIESPQPGKPIRLVQLVRLSNAKTFDQLLLVGLRGQADTDGDQRVTLGELLDYLRGVATSYPEVPIDAPERNIPLAG